MAPYKGVWALPGGWAVDAWLGHVTRDHGDVDLAVFDQQALFEHLADWQLVAHEEGATEGGADLWDGRPLVIPAHAHGRSPEESGPLPERFDEAGARVLFAEDGFFLDIQFCERTGDDWVLNREFGITLPLSRCIRTSGWGLPTAAQEVILFLKATLYHGTKNYLRPRDEADFVALLPQVTDEQRGWLRGAISTVRVDHPWLERL
jgi:hypothetical protein